MTSDDSVIAVIDVETTGLNKSTDQIIEFAVQKGLTAPTFRESWRIKPKVKISKEAQEIHGISEEDLKDCPNFKSISGIIRKVLQGSDVIVGYNIYFDLEMLQAEFTRLGEELNLSNKIILDPYKVWTKCEPRKLEDACERFLKKKHSNSHSAKEDIVITGEVLDAMIEKFGLHGMTWSELQQFSDPERSLFIGPSHHFKWKNKKPIVQFGRKYKNQSLFDVRKDRGYLEFLVGGDFPKHVKKIAKACLEKSSNDELINWLEKEFGQPRG